jgi:hypothetical protein
MSAFSDYAQRIDVATTQLEADVASVSAFSGDLTTAVTRAETAAVAAESELTTLLETKPLFKGEYGSVEEYVTRIVINTQEQVESFFGTLFKAKAGCTGISLDVIPQTDLDAFHCYVRNESGTAISVTSSVGDVDTPVVPNGSFVRITLNAAKSGWEVVSYTTEGSESPVRFERLLEASSYDNQLTTAVGTPVILTYGTSPINTAGDAINYDGLGGFSANITGQYIVYVNASLGRTGVAQATEFAAGVIVSGVKQDNPRYVSLGDSEEVFPFSATYTLNLNAGDVAQFYIEAIAGTNGGVFAQTTVSPQAPSTSVVFSRITGAVVSGGGGGAFDWTTIPEATQQQKGLMSAEDKVKLDGIEEGAQKNVNADFNATAGDALILNKPTVAYEGDLVFEPVSEQYVYDDVSARDGYMTYLEKRQLIALDGRTLVDEAPTDGQQYARQNGGWSVVAGGGGGASFPTYEDIITRGKGPVFDPVNEITEYAAHVLITNRTQWDAIKSPAGLMEAVYGVRNIEDVPYHLGPVPVVFRNTYSSAATNHPELAPFAISSYSFCLVEMRPHASFYEEQQRPVNLEGGGVWCKVTFISNNSSDIRNNDPVAANAPAFTRTIQPREYVNNSYSAKIGITTPETAVVQWPFAWSEMVYTTVTGAPT